MFAFYVIKLNRTYISLFNHLLIVCVLNAAGDKLEELKSKPLIIQEGCHYRVKIYFYVQREIVQGLKYVQQSYKMGVRGWFH